MKIINRQILDQAMRNYPDCKNSLESWFAECSQSVWTTPQEIKNIYRPASFLHNNIVILNIKGNTYRLVLKVAYKTGVVYINGSEIIRNMIKSTGKI